MRAKKILKKISLYQKSLVFIFTPLLLLPLPIILQTPESQCAYAMLLMAIFWVTEVVDLAVTGLIPLILFPLFGLMKSSDVCKNYIKDISMMLMGGLMVAIAIEHSNLHKRIAIRILMAMGTQPRWLMLGFMIPTFVLSMWISNTAASAMMIPIAMVVTETRFSDHATPDRAGCVLNEEPEDAKEMSELEHMGSGQTNPSRLEETENLVKKTKEKDKMLKAMCLCVAYAANVGGIATLSGTPPNLVHKEFIDRLYADRGLPSPITFTSWMAFGLPLAIACLFVCWFWLQLYFLGFRFNEVAVLCHFIILVGLWFFRQPGFMPGWGALFPSGYATDGTAAILVSTSLFIFPSSRPRLFSHGSQKEEKPPCLLDWEVMSAKMPWGLLFMVGGGFALADASQKSGLTVMIGQSLEVFRDLPRWVIGFIITALVAGMTEFTSNTATTTLIIPIIANMIPTHGIHPIILTISNMAESVGMSVLFLTIPATAAASFAFMLPVATGPNAVVFSYGYLKVSDMVKCGFCMNFICLIVLTTAVNTYGRIFDWENEASPQNLTMFITTARSF